MSPYGILHPRPLFVWPAAAAILLYAQGCRSPEAPPPKPESFVFAVLADVQYADKDTVEAPGQNAYALIEASPAGLKELGFGAEPSREMPFRPSPKPRSHAGFP